MYRYILARVRREPIPALAVVLFSLILVAILRTMSGAVAAQQEAYEKTWNTIPVPLTVTNLSGTKSDSLNAPGWVADVFTGGNGVGLGLSDYMKDIRIKSTRLIDNADAVGAMYLAGLTVLEAEPNFRPEKGVEIFWLEGYDASIFSGEEQLCLAPETLNTDMEPEIPGQQLSLIFSYSYLDEKEEVQTVEYTLILTVAGYFQEDSNAIYCPYDVISHVFQKVRENRSIAHISATLVDNNLLEDIKRARSTWFAEPTPGGIKTEWNYLGFDYYPYALDINDSLLVNAATTLENSIFISQVCSILIYVVSGGAGFLVGFLMIRKRKREIDLLRTLGTGTVSVFAGFALEQLLCIGLGILTGAAVFGWHPLSPLLILGGIYAAGLTVALLTFLQGSLLVNMKEEE